MRIRLALVSFVLASVLSLQASAQSVPQAGPSDYETGTSRVHGGGFLIGVTLVSWAIAGAMLSPGWNQTDPGRFPVIAMLAVIGTGTLATGIAEIVGGRRLRAHARPALSFVGVGIGPLAGGATASIAISF